MNKKISNLDLHFFSAHKARIELKDSNVFIGISLGKPLTVEIAKDYLRWVFDNSRKSIVLIADDINAISYINLHGYSEKSAFKKVRKQGDKIEKLFHQAAADIQQDITVIRWRDITTARFNEVKDLLTAEFKKNDEFKNSVLRFVDKYLEQRKNVPESINKEELAEYILSELPTLLEGIEHEEERYNVILYPTLRESGMSEFVVSIQEGKYPELKEKLALRIHVLMIESTLNSAR